MRREDGFTLIELVAVMVIMGVLLTVAIGFSQGARVRAADATAQSNIEVAVPAISAYGIENDGFSGMTLGRLQTSYAPGIAGVTVVSADATGYCISSTVEGRSWYKPGPAGAISTTPCP